VKKLSADNPAPSSPTSQRPEAARSSGYFEATRSNDALELIQLNPLAFTLAYIIAARANWHHGFNRHNLGFGEAFLGDYKECGMSERNYRTAKEQLAKWNFATFKPTNKGTIARLTDTRLFKINPPKDDGQNANVRRTADGQPTTNLNLKAGKQESSKAYSTKANKLSGRQKELADRMEAALGDQWVNDAGKWIGRIKEHFGTSERVVAEVESWPSRLRLLHASALGCLRRCRVHCVSSRAEQKIRLAVYFHHRRHCAESNCSASFEARNLGVR